MTSAKELISAVLEKANVCDDPALTLESRFRKEAAMVIAQECMLTQLRDNVRTMEETKSALEAKRQELRGQLTLRKCRGNATAAATYCGDVLMSCVFRQCVLETLTQYSPSELRYAYIDDGVEIVKGWPTFAAAVTADLRRLEQLDNIPLPLSHQRASDAFERAKAAVTAGGDALLREHSRRQNTGAIMTQLRTDQQSLLQWCRHQRASLDALTSPRAVQEYCASFHTSVSVMESNVLVLLELSESVMPNSQARELLTDVLAEWTSLVVYAYERLEGALREMHEQSNIESLAQLWYDRREETKSFLERAMSLLKMPTDEESLALTQPSAQKCEALLSTVDSFNVLMQHIATYSQRDKCIQEMFAALRRSLFAKVTPQTQLYSNTGSFPERQQYADRLAELSDWVQAHSASGAWRSMLARVEEIKNLIDRSVSRDGSDDA